MTTPANHSHVSPLDVPLDRTRTRSRAADFVALTKPRLNVLVVLTTIAAYYLGTGPNPDIVALIHTIIGTALVAGGA